MGFSRLVEEPDFLEDVVIEVLRLVHDQDGGAAGGGLVEQELIQREKDFGFRPAVALQVEIIGDHFEELVGADAGVENAGEFDAVGVELVAEAFEQGGLAGADLAGEHDEAFAAVDAVDQVCERLFVLGASVKEGRIRTEVERTFAESEEGVVHAPPATGAQEAGLGPDPPEAILSFSIGRTPQKNQAISTSNSSPGPDWGVSRASSAQPGRVAGWSFRKTTWRVLGKGRPVRICSR